MMRLFYLYGWTALLWLLCWSSTQAQQTANHEPRQLLVQLYHNASIAPVVKSLERQYPDLQWEAPQRLVPNLNLWWLRYQGNVSAPTLLERVWQSPLVEMAQLNHRVSLRSPQTTTPNDLLYTNQWQHKNTGSNGGTAGVDMDSEDAWDITTGGLTANGDTIVVAVIDNGINPSHPDWGNNLWHNHAEIPNNNLDDDNNGYIDDYDGWNSNTATDNISGGTHGTSVAGIIGAQGNNNVGVVGINWNVKMMIIRNDFNTTEANVLIAYGYAYNQRRRYNQSNGTEGAYVVVTNASWGINFGNANNSPLWCAFYDTLGQQGILNIAATANQETDVEVNGDMPTTCSSDFLIGVTNVNRLGLKQFNSAFGAQSIDLGAFGADVYTTTNSSYGNFGGTSGASPQVAGAVALLYSGACSNFNTFAAIRPDAAALAMRRYILSGVVSASDLNGRTVTGGYLNLNNSLLLCLNDCPVNTCFQPYNIQGDSIRANTAHFSWSVGSTTQSIKYRFRVTGGTWSAFTPLPNGQNSVSLAGLTPCTEYELELISMCPNSVQSNATLYTFKTDGCCKPPNDLHMVQTNADSALLQWSPILAANQYEVEYRTQGTTNWTSVISNTTSIWIDNLLPCQHYEMRISTICPNGSTSPSATTSFITLGCSSCTQINYCPNGGINATDDWIENVRINAYLNNSGNNNGYLLVPSTGLELGRGDSHSLTIEQGNNYGERFRVWLDLNQDGDFSDPFEELVSDQLTVGQRLWSSNFRVPNTALLGPTRMRIALRWRTPPTACDSVDFGEVEDYCVRIIRGINVEKTPAPASSLSVAPNPFQQGFRLSIALQKRLPLTVELINTTGQTVHQQQWTPAGTGEQQLDLQPNVPIGVYWLRLYNAEQQWTTTLIKQ